MGVPVGSKRYDDRIIKRLLRFYTNNPKVFSMKETGRRLNHSHDTIRRYNEHLIDQGVLKKTPDGWSVINKK